jgi:hypothetical protein
MNEMQLKLLGFRENVMQRWSREIHNGTSPLYATIVIFILSRTELRDQTLHMLLDVRILWGRKPFDSALSIPSEMHDHQTVYSFDWAKYLDVHHTQETWREVTDRRQKPPVYTAKPTPFVDRHPMLPYSVIQRGERKKERRH